MPSRCAIWARVSADEQETGNQLPELRQWAARRGLEVAAEYVVDGASAWKGEHREQIATALADARLGKYDVLLVWSLDRIDREGVESTLGLLRHFHQAGAPGWSLNRSYGQFGRRFLI
jgi:DNA invertase Pin-like site-specific DNA recombinase